MGGELINICIFIYSFFYNNNHTILNLYIIVPILEQQKIVPILEQQKIVPILEQHIIVPILEQPYIYIIIRLILLLKKVI